MVGKLTDKIKEQIIADYKAGISQNQLAKNYKLSPATINKLCKNIPQRKYRNSEYFSEYCDSDE